ncbi:MAG: hypothetical protein ACOCRX_08550 [Candidatus Woesearchaeota archaeon]
MSNKKRSRVKHLPSNDGFYNYNSNLIEGAIEKYEKESSEDINDIIEIYNIKKYFDEDSYPDNWSEEDIEDYSGLVKKRYGQSVKFLKKIDEKELAAFFEEVVSNYKEDYLELVEKFKLFKKISSEKIKELVNNGQVSLSELLRYKKIVNYHEESIKELMLKNQSSARILLDKHTSQNDFSLNIPNDLTKEDIKKIFNNYIEHEDASLNYLRLIIASNRPEITSKMKAKAKRKVENKKDEIFSEGIIVRFGNKIEIADLEEGTIDIVRKSDQIIFRYDKSWIENNLDFPTILNNFIFLFEFVDLQARFTLVNKETRMSPLERIMEKPRKRVYRKGRMFYLKDQRSSAQLKIYYEMLRSLNIKIEEVIEWFFNDYLNSEFRIDNFKINIPSNNSSMLEKCNIMASNIHLISKKFKLLTEEGEINNELLEYMRFTGYDQILSLVNKKYVYMKNNENIKNICHLFFSDQSPLIYIKRLDFQYKNFFQIIRKEEIKINDFEDYSLKYINTLVNNDYLKIDKKKNIKLKNHARVLILFWLYQDEVINYWNTPKEIRDEINKMHQENLVSFDQTLFSKPEQDYLNYFLNDSKFGNGPALRNKYAHGAPLNLDHGSNYLIFLKIVILFVIKINNDLNNKEKEEKFSKI